MPAPDIAAEWIPIADLVPWDENPRHNDDAVDEVAGSIQRFGFAAPIIARRADSMVIAGHTRLKAAHKLGINKVPVRWMDLDPAEARLLALADNKLNERAAWDDDTLAAVLEALNAEGADLDGLGWDSDEIDALIATIDPVELPEDIEPAEPPRVPDSRPGEIYELGPHRLVCGDSTDPTTIAALFGDEHADIILTDPPYCSGGFQEAGRAVGSTTATTGATIARDNLTTEGLQSLIEKAVGRLPAVGCCYVFCDWRQIFAIRRAVEPLGYQYRSLIVWDKGSPGMGGPWRHQYELVYFGTRRKEPSIGASGDILRHNRSGNVHHTTEKPLALLVDILSNTVGGIVGDPFGGSGTTLLAAAKTGRSARLVELDPRYCDVIRDRWTRWALEAGQDPGTGALTLERDDG